MSGSDFTRWNRAQLPRFRYVDANAATHLEALRIELAARFAQWSALTAAIPVDETVSEQMLRILNQYKAERRDWAWETTRTFARALHILTEHVDAFANEGYLRTATQLSSIHKLAAMIGYSPAPASSAATSLVLIAKPEVTVATVKRGFAVKSLPPGAPPVIFETLADIDIMSALNAVRLEAWNVNVEPLGEADVFPTAPRPALWNQPKDFKASAGGVAVVAKIATAGGTPVPLAAAKIVTQPGSPLAVSRLDAVPLPLPPDLNRDNACLYVSPAQVLVPAINGTGAVRMPPSHGLVAGDVVAWKNGGNTDCAAVVEAGDGAIRLETAGSAALPAAGTKLYRAVLIAQVRNDAGLPEWRVTIQQPERTDSFHAIFPDSSNGKLAPPLPWSALSPERAGPDAYFKLTAGIPAGTTRLWLSDPGVDKPVAEVAAALDAAVLEFSGAPSGLASGDPVLLQAGGDCKINRIERIEKDAGTYRLILMTAAGSVPVTAVHAAFAAPLRPIGAGISAVPVAGSKLPLALADWPAALAGGRALVLESAGSAFDPLPCRAIAVDTLSVPATITIDKTLPADLTVSGVPSATLLLKTGDLIIRANVAAAGHGETKPALVLGSGDASATGQSFEIDMPDVSQVRDVSMPGGIRADLTVQVGDEFYKQVASLRDSEPSDPHFVVKTAESGTLTLRFGDGRHGRRLQSGTNNVRAIARKGSGPSGNLPAGALTDIVKKHPAVESFLQPVAAIGGSEPETLDRIRSNAPGRLVAMDRAISVADYRQLALRFQGVWHAVAYERLDLGRGREGVNVVIVPAGGGALGALRDEIRSYLSGNGLPAVSVQVEDYESLPLELLVRVRLDSARYDPRGVEAKVRAAILAAFDLRVRKPGQPLYRSEVYRIVEGIEGVENSDALPFRSVPVSDESRWQHATRGDDDGIWAVYPRFGQVIHAANPALVSIETAEATI